VHFCVILYLIDMVMLHLSQFVNSVQSLLVKVSLSYIAPNFNLKTPLIIVIFFSFHPCYHYMLVV